MNIKYSQSASTIKPLPVEITDSTIYLRRNIVVDNSGTTNIENERTTPYFKYEEAMLNSEEFNEYVKYTTVVSALDGEYSKAKLVALMINQEAQDNNQLIIMSAIADLYNEIESLKPKEV